MSKTSVDSNVRTFLAVTLPDLVRSRLGALESKFTAQRDQLKWVAPPLLHITVRFLGGIAESRLPEIEAAVQLAGQQVEPFSLELSGLGAFPNERAPRVIWVGLERNVGYSALERLYQATEDALAARGFSRENRRFAPHITLARTRDTITSQVRRAVGETLASVRVEYPVRGSFAVKELIVMRSDLARSGPTYTPMWAVPLGSR